LGRLRKIVIDYSTPSKTLELLAELEALGFDDSAFSVMHHFAKPVRIARHRGYCEMLQREGGAFRTNSNRLVQRRLAMVLAMYKAGNFASGSSEVFQHLAHAAVAEVPHDRR
jgi:hypothetical protein